MNEKSHSSTLADRARNTTRIADNGTRKPAPHWDDIPRALAEGTRLRVVSAAAGKEGVRAGMTIPEARARLAAIDIREWDTGTIDDAVLAMTTTLLVGSPQVTPVIGSPGTWFVGANGLGDEHTLASTLLTLAKRAHPDARVAIADSCVSARAATWAPKPRPAPAGRAELHARELRAREAREGEPPPGPLDPAITIVPPGGCAAYLAPAPLGLVPMDDELRDGLHALGLRTMGALAALEPGDIERRWGPEGLRAWRLARGDDPRRPGLVRVDAARTAGVELPAPAEGTAPVLFAMRALLERLVRELVEDGRAAAAVSVTLVLDAGRSWPLTNDDRRNDSTTDSPTAVAERAYETRDLLAIPHRTITREVRPARPVARFDPLFDQCRMLLERWTIPAPILGITLGIPATAPLAADQGDLLIPSWRDAAMNAEAVFARLRAVLDPDNNGDIVVHAVQGDSHRPEHAAHWESADAVELAKPVTGETPRTRDTASGTTSVAANGMHADATREQPTKSITPVLRLLETPEVVDVEETGGAPDAAWWRGRRLAFNHVDGPERLSGDWWHDDRYARDYWRCTAAPKGELLLYREEQQWYVQGWMD